MECNSVVNGTEKITSPIDFPCCVLIEADTEVLIINDLVLLRWATYNPIQL